MDWKVFLTIFGTVLLAELGDKTQLATMMFSTQEKNPLIVFVAAALALVLSSFIAVVVGQAAAKVIPANLLQGIAGFAFIIIGLLLVFPLIKH